MKIRGNYIDGKWIQSPGNPLVSIDPSNNKTIWSNPPATKENINEAITAASKAFCKWARLSILERVHFIQKFEEKLKEHRDYLEKIISLETGKPLWESKGEVDLMISKVNISIKAYQERCSEKEIQLTNQKSITRHRPQGVLVVLGPYNFPGHLPNGHIIPALLSGNTIIFKPSEHTPYVGQETVAIWEEAGLPPGVLNLTLGGKEVGIQLCESKEIHGILFTGSWNTGSILTQKYSLDPRKILALEMGGNNCIILGNSHNLEAAAYATLVSAYITTGQRCTCARRLIVPKTKQGDHFLKLLTEMIKKISIGSPTDKPEPFMGPLISAEAAMLLLQTQEKLIKLGGKPLIEMKKIDINDTFVSPGLIDVSEIKNLPDEEYFGPLLQLIRVKDFNEALEEANNTEYGLSASLLSDDKYEYETFFNIVRAGVINWNVPTIGASSAAPFGGIGKSGNFRPSGYYAVDYTTYPVASLESQSLEFPKTLFPGLESIKEDI